MISENPKPSSGEQGLRGQTCATLGTATGQHLPAVGSGHTGTETVDALTLQDARLKRSFHGDDLTIQSWEFSNWLENVQPKQERHSMQLAGKIQWLLPVSGRILLVLAWIARH